MKTFGNILWVILGGFIICIYYYLLGLVLCITIIGIPFGLQLFKIGTFSLCPFGKSCVSGPKDSGCLSVFMNILWILVGGIEIAFIHIAFGILLCVTIIGIPFGLQHFKMTLLALMPFGKEIVED